jgi:hypothetical protein
MIDYPDLPFKRYVAACRREHSRRLALPWYLSTIPSENWKRDIWRRQAKRYAEWYAVARLGAPAHVRVWLSDLGGIYIGSNLLGFLPDHVKFGYVQEEPTPCQA